MKITIYKNDDAKKPMFMDYEPKDEPRDFFGKNVGEIANEYAEEKVITADKEDELYEELYEDNTLFKIMQQCYTTWLDENF